jgi:hypothetical protein
MSQIGNRLRIAVKGSVTDDRALSMVDIKYRREAEVDPACT